MAIDFKGAHFPPEVILMGVRWYVAYPLSTRHVEELMEERGVEVDHSTINRWVIKYSPQLEEAFHRRKRPGRVPAGCGYGFGTSPQPSERGPSAGQQPATPIFQTPSLSLGLSRRTLSRSPPRSATGLLVETVGGGGHGGPRDRRTACRVHPWAVRPAASAGGHGRHRWPAPRPCGTAGAGHGGRRRAGGQTQWGETCHRGPGSRQPAAPWPRGWPRRPMAATR